jgi:hypothetical protein
MLHGQRGKGELVHRDEHKAHAEALQQPGVEDRLPVHHQAPLRHLPQRRDGDHEASADREPSIHFACKPRGNLHGDQDPNTARRQQHAGVEHGVAEQRLEHRRQQREHTEHHDADHHHEQQ